MTQTTPDAPYRAAVIGCGAIGSSIEDVIRGASYRMGLPYGHAPVYHALPRTTLIAGADTDAGRRADFAQRWHVAPEHVYADYRDLLANERIDIVSIASPTPLHAQMALEAVQNGVRAIFLEKPIASTLADADRVTAACAEAGIPLMVNHTRRGDPAYRQARKLIDDGTIGQLHSLTAHFGGHLMWSGTHAFDLLNYFNGDRPAAWISGHLDDAPLDPGGSAYIVYESGVRAFVNGTAGNPILFRVEAIGTAGMIVIGNYDLELWRVNEESPRRELVRHHFPQVLPAVAPMAALINELLDALEGGPEPMSNGRTSTSALELIVGLHMSSSNGNSRIEIADVDRDMVIRSN